MELTVICEYCGEKLSFPITSDLMDDVFENYEALVRTYAQHLITRHNDNIPLTDDRHIDVRINIDK